MPRCPICGCIPPRRTRILVEQMKGRTDKTGQFVLPVGEAQERSRRAVRAGASGRGSRATSKRPAALSEGHAHGPQRSRRRVQSRQPAAVACGQKVEAEAAYRAAIEGRCRASRRPGTIWPIILDDQGQADKAVVCLSARSTPIRTMPMRCSISAFCTSATNRHAQAAPCWRRYLALDKQLVLGVARQAGLEILRNAVCAFVADRLTTERSWQRAGKLRSRWRAAIRSRTTRQKRDFSRTAEPEPRSLSPSPNPSRTQAGQDAGWQFVVQKHDARRAALRSAARARRRAQELGGDARAEPRRRREAARRPHRRPPDASISTSRATSPRASMAAAP